MRPIIPERNPETLITIGRYEASNFIAKMTESISKSVIEEVLKSFGLTEKDYTLSYNSVYNGLSPNGQPNDGGPDLLISTSKLNLKIAIEVKYRAEGYTGKSEFSKRFNKFNGSDRNYIIFFTGYTEENLNKVRAYCNQDNITLISVDRIPYTRKDDTFQFSPESLCRWIYGVSLTLKSKLSYYLSKLIPQHDRITEDDINSKIIGEHIGGDSKDRGIRYDRVVGKSTDVCCDGSGIFGVKRVWCFHGNLFKMCGDRLQFYCKVALTSLTSILSHNHLIFDKIGGSRNRGKQRIELTKLYERFINVRDSFLRRFSNCYNVISLGHVKMKSVIEKALGISLRRFMRTLEFNRTVKISRMYQNCCDSETFGVACREPGRHHIDKDFPLMYQSPHISKVDGG